MDDATRQQRDEAAALAHEAAGDAERLARDELGNCLFELESQAMSVSAALANLGEHGEADAVQRLSIHAGAMRGSATILASEAKRLQEELARYVKVEVEHE